MVKETMYSNRIDAYKTTDGKIFSDIKEAFDRQSVLDFGEILDKDPLCGNRGGAHVEPGTLLEWLSRNKEAVMEWFKLGTI